LKALKKAIIHIITLLLSVTAISCADNADKQSGTSQSKGDKSLQSESLSSASEQSTTPSAAESEIDESIFESIITESLAESIAESITESRTESQIPAESQTTSQTTSEDSKDITKNPTKEFVMMYQTDPKYANHPYGNETVGGYACGPSVMAVIIKNLTGADVDPVTMSDWSYANGHYAAGIGSYYTLMPAAAKNWGLECKTYYSFDKAFLRKTLESGQMVLVVMGPGTFTYSGHFMILRGFDENGMLIIADTQSEKKTNKVWDFDFIYSELKKGSPIWTFK